MLSEQRRKIDAIDKTLVALFEERMLIAKEVVAIKKANDLPILDTNREVQVLEKVCGYLSDKSLSEYLREFYAQLMKISKEYQTNYLDDTQF